MEKPLYIPPSKGETGLKVYCRNCRKVVYGVCKKSLKPIETCTFGDSHVYKVSIHVPGTKFLKKSKYLETRLLSEAKKEAIDFNNLIKEQFNKNIIIPENSILKPIVSLVENLNKPEFVEEAIFKYFAFLSNEGVAIFNRKNRGQRHLRDLKNELLFLLKVLKDNGYDPSTLRISAFYSEEIISAVYSSLNKKYSERTLKKRFTLYKAFELWLHEELKYPLSESWKKISIKDPIYEPKAVSKDEYYRLLKVITPENGMGEAMKNGKIIQKNYFKSWIVIAIKLALETGCRREELIQMKFEDIIEIKGEKPYLRVENLKVNRINGLVDHKKKIYTPIPISHGLIELLKELGINEYQNTARYLLAPEKTEHRNALMDYLTRAFTHFYKLINPNAELKFKNLRKTNLTYKKIFNSSNTTHSKGGVIEKHYEDKVAIARGLFGYQLFTEDLEQKAPVNYWA